MELVQNY